MLYFFLWITFFCNRLQKFCFEKSLTEEYFFLNNFCNLREVRVHCHEEEKEGKEGDKEEKKCNC
jgi:hypothetical protein